MKRLHSITDFPSYRSGRRSFNVSLSGTAAGEDIIGDEGDEGLPADEGDCCDCPPGGLLEERVLERPRGGDGASFVSSDGPWSAIRARLPITDEERSSVSAAVWVVTRDVDLLLGVEGVLKSRAVEEFVSHVDGGRKGSMQQEPKPRVREDKYRPLKCRKAAEAGLYTGEDKGRLCALVRAQLVRAQHADAAPGAVDNDASISGR
ncbi:predicted protein [Postia placenta Mad-698-R]|nr:predicted protein [Postia placenta Mad-698-R]